jgi:8-oxo-dGTP pyrophosphatase MutT (NUDIX family)
MNDREIEQIDTRVVYQNRWMTVREERVRRPDGNEGLFGIVDKPDYALIIPFDGQKFHLVGQYRYPVAGRYWEFPQGSWQHDPNADPLEVARGELAEETGFRAKSIVQIGRLFQAYGYSNQAVHIFFASDLIAGPQQLDSEEQGLVVKSVTPNDFNAMIGTGEISDISTVAAAQLYTRYIESK